MTRIIRSSPRSGGNPRSLATLQKELKYGKLYNFLQFFSSDEISRHDDHFNELTMNASYWTVSTSGGTSAANFAIQTLAGGVIRGDTGTTDNGDVAIIGPIIYSGDNYAGCEARFKFDDVTGLAWECGLIDAVPGSNTGAVNDLDTPTSYATDYAVFRQDTDQTLVTASFITDGTSIAAAKNPVADTAVPATATYMTIRIQCHGSNNLVSGWVNGKFVGTGSLEGGILLAPWFWCKTTSTTAVFPDIDYFNVWSLAAA